MRIGIAGFGFVGQAVASCLKSPPVVYDPYKGIGKAKDLYDLDIVFCCIGTPMGKNGRQNFEQYETFFSEQRWCGHEHRPIYVVKSTVLYSNIEPYLSEFSIVMNPEFLSQNSAHEDFEGQNVIVLGGRADHCKLVEKAYRDAFDLDYAWDDIAVKYCTVQEAIEAKYFHNIYHAYKVLFWNYVHELATDGNHRKIAALYSAITGNRHEMQNICADGKPGYGGACFPKDVAAFHGERAHPLTAFMLAYNGKLRGDT